MKKVAIYPGSFNPWHEGHDDVLDKALKVFDEVIIAQGVNPDKSLVDRERLPVHLKTIYFGRVRFAAYKTMLIDFIASQPEISAIIRGLRNGKDLEDERLLQYWNEDFSKEFSIRLPPTVYFLTDRSLVHVSSSAHRIANELRRGRGQ